MTISEILRIQPSLDRPWQNYCSDDDDEKFEAELNWLGLTMHDDGEIYEK